MQISETEAAIERETLQFQAEEMPNQEAVTSKSTDDYGSKRDEEQIYEGTPKDTVGSDTNKHEGSDRVELSTTSKDQPSMAAESGEPSQSLEALKDQNDDGGEVMEGVEDTVIY